MHVPFHLFAAPPPPPPPLFPPPPPPPPPPLTFTLPLCVQGLPVWILTGGGDRCVRCWDLVQPRSSYTLCGLKPGQERHYYDHSVALPLADAVRSPGQHFRAFTGDDGLSRFHRNSRALRAHPPPMIFCQTPFRGMGESPYATTTPAQQHKGPIPALASHEDVITCMAWLDQPTRVLITGSRDGVIKVWK